MMWTPKAYLSVLIILCSLIGYPGFGESKTNSMNWDRVFFFKDVFNLIGVIEPSPKFGEIQSISQPFSSSCKNFNRIIIPFFVQGENQEGKLEFQLNRVKEGAITEVFSTEIDFATLPPPSKIGTMGSIGILHSIWIPALEDSLNGSFIWGLKNSSSDPVLNAGIYTVQKELAQTQFISFDDKVRKGLYSAFYTYCKYEFHGDEILDEITNKIAREKIFTIVYILILASLIVGVFKLRTPEEL